MEGFKVPLRANALRREALVLLLTLTHFVSWFVTFRPHEVMIPL